MKIHKSTLAERWLGYVCETLWQYYGGLDQFRACSCTQTKATFWGWLKEKS